MDRILTTADLIGRPADKAKGRPRERGLLPVTKVTLWRWVRDGKFPQPLRLGEARVGWRQSDVDRWLETRARVDYASENAEV